MPSFPERAPASASVSELDALSDVNHPKFLCRFPDGSIAAYGGDEGTVVLLPRTEGEEPEDARRFEEPIRALAVSDDGRRVAMGHDDGSTTILCYDSHVNEEDVRHPFLSSAGNDGGDDNSDDEGLLTQSDGMDGDSGTNGGAKQFSGPRFDAPVRCLLFAPRPDGVVGDPYRLAVATESSPGFCVVDASSEEALMEGGRYLEGSAGTHHDHGGVRGMAYGGASLGGDGGADDAGTVLATLGMDGRLCLWSCPSGKDSDPLLDWDLIHRDAAKCVPRSDVGELNGSDVSDRSSVPVWSPDGSWLALPGKADVQLRRATDVKSERFIISDSKGGHVDAIVAMAFSPDSAYLATSARDGRVCVWEINERAGEEGNASSSAAPGRFLSEIRTDPPLPGGMGSTHIAWSSEDGKKDVLRLLYADGKVVSVKGRDAIVARSPSRERGAKGAMSLSGIDAVEEEEKKKRKEHAALSDDEDDQDGGMDTQDFATQPPAAAKQHRFKKSGAGSGPPSDDDDEDFVESDNKYKGEKAPNPFIADEADEGEDEKTPTAAAVESEKALSADAAGNALDEAADERPDTQDMMGDFVAHRDDDYDDNVPEYDNHADGPSAHHGAAFALPEPQPAFAPSSTPIDSAGDARILCWNHVGVVTLRSDEASGDATGKVDISFLDGAFRRPLSFTDNLGFILGCAGNDGAIFATDVADDDDGIEEDDDELNGVGGLSESTKRIVRRSAARRRKKGEEGRVQALGSSVYFHRFETFGNPRDKDWHIALPDGELVLGCACGEGWAAVATSRRFLRLFSSGGNQGSVLWLKGDPVCLVGRGRFLAVFYHESTPLPDATQRIGYDLYDASPLSSVGGGASLIGSGTVSALSAGSSLTWAGFDNNFSLVVKDGEGMLSMLVRQESDPGSSHSPVSSSEGGWAWSPVLDTFGHHKSREDTFWPVSVEDGRLVCVLLKGGVSHPDPSRRPVTTSLGLRMPLATRSGSASKVEMLEEVSVRANASLRQQKFLTDRGLLCSDSVPEEEILDEYDKLCTQVDKVTLKLYFSVLRTGKLERALDLVHRLHIERSLDIAVKASERFGYDRLSDRIDGMRERRFPPVSLSGRPSIDAMGDEEKYYEDPSRISPPSHLEAKKRPHEEEDDAAYQSPDEREHTRQSRGADCASALSSKSHTLSDKKQKRNPFGKRRIETPQKSPAKARIQQDDEAPQTPTSPVPRLKRNSTFSAESRKRSKVAKRLL